MNNINELEGRMKHIDDALYSLTPQNVIHILKTKHYIKNCLL